MYDTHMSLFDVTDDDLYNKEVLIKTYNKYNEEVINYFGNREDFLLLNLAEDGSYNKFLEFMKEESPYTTFMHKNKSK